MEGLLGGGEVLLRPLSESIEEGESMVNIATDNTTRHGVEARLSTFLASGLADYEKHRNFVSSSAVEVSRLSPALRHRIVTEYSVARSALDAVGPSASEKYRQEIYWRLYWKGYLERRPEIWHDYLASTRSFSAESLDRAAEVERGESPVEVMNYFARQLVETGYLHNHGRMWFAAIWIHTLRLPWQLGARFFQSHLLDGDPASNTLSWRWVAGLHTRGKTYLARKSNLARYLDPEILGAHPGGLYRIDDSRVEPAPLSFEEAPPPRDLPEAASTIPAGIDRPGIWIHEDDLDLESSPTAGLGEVPVLISPCYQAWETLEPSPMRMRHLEAVLADAEERAISSSGSPIRRNRNQPIAEILPAWAEEHGLSHLVFLHPFQGAAREALESIRRPLAERGIDLCPIRRAEDAAILPLARAGFFGFWKKAARVSLS